VDYFAGLTAFVRAVELGSFSRAAAEAGIKVSTVSRYVTALEADLGAALFNRSTRRLHLTEVGATFYERTTRILEDLADARLAATALNESPKGLLRLNIPGAFGRRHIVPHLGDFLAAHPAIHLDVTLTDETVDLIASGADLAVRIGALAESSLIAKRLAPHHRVLVASPAYLASHPPIDHPADLQHHECLPFALQPKPAWYFLPPEILHAPASEPIEVPVRGRLRANDSEALLDAVCAGIGIALLPTWLTGEALMAGQLTPLLPAWHALIAPGSSRAIWGVYPPKKVVAPKVRAFLAFLETRFGRPPYWDHTSPSAPAKDEPAARPATAS
jgi:DNA-binding transcriptional LysR family regulator